MGQKAKAKAEDKVFLFEIERRSIYLTGMTPNYRLIEWIGPLKQLVEAECLRFPEIFLKFLRVCAAWRLETRDGPDSPWKEKGKMQAWEAFACMSGYQLVGQNVDDRKDVHD